MEGIAWSLSDMGLSPCTCDFIGREEETRHLESNFTYGINTVLISPRGWGKTSLVDHVRESVFGKCPFKVVYLDVFTCKSGEDLCGALASAVIAQSGEDHEIWDSIIKGLREKAVPALTLDKNGNGFHLEFSSESFDPWDLLSLPELFTEKTGKRLMICMDEFQQVGNFSDTFSVQAKLRGVWQLQKYTRYCLAGSHCHSMTAMFQDSSMPFYQFGDVMHLGRIPSDTWVSFIRERFHQGGKSIGVSLANDICSTVERYSAYVRQLACFSFMYTPEGGSADGEILSKAVGSLILSNEPQFMQVIEPLTFYQMNFLKAILCGHVKDYGMESVRTEFHLGSSSNISRLKQTLIGKDVIDSNMRELSIPNPVFRMWLSRRLL